MSRASWPQAVGPDGCIFGRRIREYYPVLRTRTLEVVFRSGPRQDKQVMAARGAEKGVGREKRERKAESRGRV